MIKKKEIFLLNAFSYFNFLAICPLNKRPPSGNALPRSPADVATCQLCVRVAC